MAEEQKPNWGSEPLTEPVTVTLIPREDGGLSISSKELPGLILSGADPKGVMLAILPAVSALRQYERIRKGEA